MLIPNTLFIVVSIAFGLSLLLGLPYFVKRYFDSYYGVLLGLIFSGFAFGAMQAAFGKIYVVNEDLSHSAYRYASSLTYTFENQTAILIEFQRGQTGLINNSNKSLVLDKVTYGTEGYFQTLEAYSRALKDKVIEKPEPTQELIIDPYTFQSLELYKQTINFFFDEEIPRQIEEYGVKGKITKYWLHLAE